MGIRVKKVVGWGLTDLKHNANGQPEDDRLDPEGYLLSYGDDERREETWSAEGYRKFLCERFGVKLYSGGAPTQDALAFELTSKRKKLQWEPWDSVIHDGEFGMSNVFVVIPFCMALRGEGQVWKRYDDLIDYTEESHVHGCQSRVLELPDGIYPWARSRDEPTPLAPDEVVVLCDYLRIFKDPGEARKLRPLLYVYWA